VAQKRVYPLQQGLIAASFWKAWEKMSEKGRYAHLMAAINAQQTEIDLLKKRLGELEDACAEREDPW
jgi:hypothetical protein